MVQVDETQQGDVAHVARQDCTLPALAVIKLDHLLSMRVVL